MILAKPIKIILIILSVLLIFLSGVLTMSSFGHVTILSSELDTVCKTLYGETFEYLKGSIGTQTSFNCIDTTMTFFNITDGGNNNDWNN